MPATDPYSYTFASLNRPFILHQWLSEITFYCIYKIGGLASLVYTCTVCLAVAFVFVPLSCLNGINRNYRNIPLTLLLVAVAPLACISRFLTRPELFSYLCVAIWFVMLAALRQNNSSQLKSSRVNWLLIAGFASVMALWANLHSGFALGIILLLYFNIEAGIIFFSEKKKNSLRDGGTTNDADSGNSSALFNITAPIAFVATACATLLNPYGIKLLTYVAGMFNSPSKAWITEMLPIVPENFAKPELWPFVLFLGLAATNVVQLASENEQFEEPDTTQKVKRYCSLGLIALTIVLAFSSRRFISFCVLTTLFQLIAVNCELLGTRVSATGGEPEVGSEAEPKVEPASTALGITHCLQKLQLGTSKAGALLVVIALITTGITITRQTLTLPQQTNFTPPFKAFDYLKDHQPSGNVYNDPHFGSMLIWYRPDAPKVFIDTRFDIYESVFVRTFGEALFGNGYEELFDRYKVTWVFLKPSTPLLQILSRDPKWEKCYHDDLSVIMKRVDPPKQ